MMTADLERARAQAAHASAWALWFLSLVAMGATFAAINTHNHTLAAPLALVMVLLAYAAGNERQEMRDALAEAELLEMAALDDWAAVWM